MTQEAVQSLARECFETKIRAEIKLSLIAEIQKKRMEGYKILLLSGAIRSLVEPMAEFVQADFIVCSETERIGGTYTGEMASLHPYGVTKQILAMDFCNKNGFDLSTALAYANEFDDRFLLDAVATPVAVHPDHELRKLAEKKNWRIFE